MSESFDITTEPRPTKRSILSARGLVGALGQCDHWDHLKLRRPVAKNNAKVAAGT